MNLLNDLVAASVTQGINMALSLGHAEPAELSVALETTGKALTDLGKAVQDGKTTPEEIDIILADIQAFGGGIFATAIKSAVSRITEVYAGDNE